jgi:hypothetical protein
VNPDEAVEPEVMVRGVRRRKKRPARPDAPTPPTERTWLIYAALTVGTAGLMFNGYLSDRPIRPPLPNLAQATDVKSDIKAADDSLMVVVTWDLTLSVPQGIPESVQVRLIPEQPPDTLRSSQPGHALADTIYLPAPPPGQSAKGLSCVAAQHGRDSLEEACTAWQYIRPSATSMAMTISPQIVLQPSGLQVDPDVGGRCAEWQRTHGDDSVWIEVNLTAVPECTGPNWKPTVAQFCAFAVLPNGRRVKTSSSINNAYCDELFAEWMRERYS